MKESNSNPRFLLGLTIVSLGLLSVGIPSPRASKTTRITEKSSQNPEVPRPRAEKYIGKYRIYPNEPVLVTDLKVNGAEHEINRKVFAGEDWLSGLTFKVKNISIKNIVYIYVSLFFPETKAIAPNIIAIDLRYGADPKLEVAPPAEKPLKPGEAAEFVISDDYYQRLKGRFEAKITPFKNINSVQIDVLRVVFDDDTGWATGAFQHRDPNNSKIWIDNN